MNKSKHLHPVSILYFTVVMMKAILSQIWIVAVIVILNYKDVDSIIRVLYIFLSVLILLLVVAIILGVLRWKSFVYEIHEDSIFVKSGMINVKKVFISADRIHSMNTSIRLYDRIFSTHTLLIELASGEDSSITFSCLSKEEEQSIRNILQKHVIEDTEEITSTTIQMSGKDIILHGFLSPKLGIVMGFILAIFFKYVDATDGKEMKSIHLFVVEYVSFGWLFIIAGIVIVLSIIVSLAFTFERNYGFILQKEQENLEISHGLLVKKQRVVAINRLQSILLIERPLQRLFGYMTIQAVIIQRGKEEDSEKTITLLPSIKREEVSAFLSSYLDYERVGRVNNLTKEASFYYKGLPFLVGIVVAIPFWVFVPFNLYYIAIVIPILLFMFGWMEYRNVGWEYGKDFVTIQYGSTTRKTAIVKVDRIQWSSVRQTILQKKRKIANVTIAIASGQNDMNITVKQIPIDDANGMVRQVNSK